jgi:hypothetical protein
MANIATKFLGVPEHNLFSALGVEQEDDMLAWKGVPEFEQREKKAEYTVNVYLRTKEDLDKFADAIGQPHLKAETKRKKDIWYPPLKTGERGQNCLVVWMDEEDVEAGKAVTDAKELDENDESYT